MFLVCLKYDAMKIAFYLNQNYNVKYNPKVVQKLNDSLQDSQWFLELKLFFIKQSFIFLNVA